MHPATVRTDAKLRVCASRIDGARFFETNLVFRFFRCATCAPATRERRSCTLWARSSAVSHGASSTASRISAASTRAYAKASSCSRANVISGSAPSSRKWCAFEIGRGTTTPADAGDWSLKANTTVSIE
eukprot:Amastigsp_a346652_38.p2 type:complete len:129 gc:universal Amastigsp_a346652_38:373-759(+)